AKKKKIQEYWFPLIYFVAYLVLLSIQGTTKTWYFMSAFPACAGLAAIGADRWVKRFSMVKIGRALAGLVLLLFALFHYTPISLSSERAVSIRRMAPYVRAASTAGFQV